MSVSALLKSTILELLQDHKLHSIPEIKDYLTKEKKLVFLEDYTKGQLSGVLHYLQTYGLIENFGRGQYMLAAVNNEKKLSNPGNKEAAKITQNDNFSKLYLEAKSEATRLYNKLSDSLADIKLSDMKASDFQAADKLLSLIEGLKTFCASD